MIAPASRFAAGPAGIAQRCAPSALRREDQRYATAPPTARWLLVEWPDGWAVHAFDTTPTLAAVAERANAAGVRAVLVRRPGRTPAPDPPAFAYVDSRPGREGTWWGRYRDEEELLGVPLSPAAGIHSTAPTYLVCTHGVHDACCAIWGRSVAAALARTRPGSTWECSHIGGDRFAPNLVALPHGLYYGHVTAETAPQVADAYEDGRVVPRWLRGRASLIAPVQAAQHHARRALAEHGVDALPPTGVAPEADGRWRVCLAAPGGGTVVVTLRSQPSVPTMLTCRATQPHSVRTFTLESLDRE